MKTIGEEIVQSSFSSEYQKLMVNLIYTNNFLSDKFSCELKEFDITRQQYNVLRILRGQYPKPASMNLIKERMLDKMSDTSRIVERLRLKNLIERAQNNHDRRGVEVRITEEGLQLLKQTEPIVAKSEEPLQNLTVEEAAQMNYLLDKLRNS